MRRPPEVPRMTHASPTLRSSDLKPGFYVQYAHSRICSLGRRFAEAGFTRSVATDLALLDDEEIALVKLAAQFPRVIEAAAVNHEPHRIAFYLGDLAAAFHALWNRGNDDPSRRFIVEDEALSRSRPALADSIGQIVRTKWKRVGEGKRVLGR